MKLPLCIAAALLCSLLVERISAAPVVNSTNSAPVVNSTNSAPVVNSTTAAQAYLARYGYMSSTQQGSATSITDLQSEMSRSLKNFQAMAGIEQTGILDERTIEMMNTPRCAVSDVETNATAARRRRRRYVYQGSRWYKSALTYNINTYSQKISQTLIRSIFPKALQFWANEVPLSFSESTSKADINIRFAVRAHGDNSPFDGKGGVLAHAYYPQNGQVHFDDDENWTDSTPAGYNLMQVATHEFGHNLGLGHSNVTSAVMAPFYTGYLPNFQLQPDDKAGIQSIYGSRGQQPAAPSAPATTTTKKKKVPTETMR